VAFVGFKPKPMQSNTPLSGDNPAPVAAVEAVKPAAPREQILPGAVYLTDEAAALTRCKPSTVRAAIRSGKIRGQGRPFRILGSELFKLV
jgi:hypothetical protein